MRRTYVVRVLQTVKKRSMVMMVMMIDGDDDGGDGGLWCGGVCGSCSIKTKQRETSNRV